MRSWWFWTPARRMELKVLFSIADHDSGDLVVVDLRIWTANGGWISSLERSVCVKDKLRGNCPLLIQQRNFRSVCSALNPTFLIVAIQLLIRPLNGPKSTDKANSRVPQVIMWMHLANHRNRFSGHSPRLQIERPLANHASGFFVFWLSCAVASDCNFLLSRFLLSHPRSRQ